MAIFQLPHGNVISESGRQIDPRPDSEKQLLEYRDAAFQQSLSELRQCPEYDEIQGYIECIEGRQNKGPGLSSWRSQYIDNRISGARIDALSYLTDIKPNISVSTQVEEYRGAADIIQRILQMEWKTRRMDRTLEEVIDHALFGTGYWKIGCSYPGQFNILSCGIDTVMPVQEGKDLQDSTAIIYRVFKPPSFFKRRWPQRSIGIEREIDPGLLLNQSNQGYNRPWSINE